MNFVMVVMALLLQDGSQEFISSVPEAFPDGVDSSPICSQRAEEMAIRAESQRRAANPDKRVVKFDFACVESPDFSTEDGFAEQIRQLHSTNLKSST